MHTLRNKVSMAWKAGSGFETFVSGELFARPGDADGWPHKWRATLGGEFMLRSHAFTLFYRLEQKTGKKGDPVAHILGLGYHYHF